MGPVQETYSQSKTRASDTGHTLLGVEMQNCQPSLTNTSLMTQKKKLLTN